MTSPIASLLLLASWLLLGLLFPIQAGVELLLHFRVFLTSRTAPVAVAVILVVVEVHHVCSSGHEIVPIVEGVVVGRAVAAIADAFMTSLHVRGGVEDGRVRRQRELFFCACFSAKTSDA